MIIAIDGPAASGKGTLAKKLAEHFGLNYLDTGSIYRALGYKILEAGGCPEDKKLAVEMAKNITSEELNNPHLYDEGIGRAASVVAVIPEVRDALFRFQRDFSKSPKGAVLDGRDIGTVICPDADLKFFITADIEVRAMRRFKQLQNNGVSVIYQSVLDDLRRRDERDSGRAVAPLAIAEDAVQVDTTDMEVSEVFEEIVAVVAGARRDFAKINN
ncbi:MAG: (d)CMP kinase [Rickettsiales bacterium]|nr:(d)CMP kinase [Pseudomonadota bacterium]MDA0967036.1 (d)CMP kinase [Pseudomonadota bacterium]MDG4542478.1 (d)CMP kinase [Rickettsiales bacterium]MDG4544982.1 (d)CMP kinase [Rickettsiales bacterium]MDG4547105.1 (d)CMP kinase [Rickettsiales bacterium]